MTTRKRQHKASDGVMAAARTLSRTALSPDLSEILDDFERLNSDEARAWYADHFLSRSAPALDRMWPVFYRMLKEAEERKLYADPTHTADHKTFASFAEYFEARVGRPFATWAELESTYHFVRDHRPELFTRTYDEVKALAAHGTNRHTSRGDNITSRRGDDPEYLTARLKRDAANGKVDPGLVDRVVKGELTPSAAARQAGIRHRYLQVRADDAASAARTLRKYMKPDQLVELARLLTEET